MYTAPAAELSCHSHHVNGWAVATEQQRKEPTWVSSVRMLFTDQERFAQRLALPLIVGAATCAA
jgi:hypothetical protein